MVETENCELKSTEWPVYILLAIIIWLFFVRFMATNDLMTELQKDSIKLDDDSERKVVKMILKLLEDKNGEVQNLAVKWYVFFLCGVKNCLLAEKHKALNKQKKNVKDHCYAK